MVLITKDLSCHSTAYKGPLANSTVTLFDLFMVMNVPCNSLTGAGIFLINGHKQSRWQ